MSNRWLHAVAFALLGTLSSHPIRSVPPRSASVGPTIAFASHRDGNWEIYTIQPDGTNETRLTRREAQDRFALWSPDRSRIAFGSQVGSTRWDLWVMDANGLNQHRVFSSIVAKGNRQWSPDGRRLVLAAIVKGDVEIVSVGADGHDALQLTQSAGDDRDPMWSPDGNRIVFTSTRDGNEEIYVMRADGTDLRRLTTDDSSDRSPSWSPDGSQIVFTSTRAGGRDLYVMHSDGTHIERLTTGGLSTNDGPRWSPDGSRIAFEVTRGKNYDIDVVSLQDHKRTTFAGSAAFDGHYAWSPDSDELAFISDRDHPNSLYIAHADGTGLRRLTDGESLNPAW